MTSFNDIRAHLITCGTVALGFAACSPQLKKTKYSEPLRIFALTLNLNLLGELAASAFIAKGEWAYSYQSDTPNSPERLSMKRSINSVTLPCAMLQSAIYGLLLAAVASVAKTRKLAATSKIFTLGLPIAVVLQFIAGASHYSKAQDISKRENVERINCLIRGDSIFELNQSVLEMHGTMGITRLFTSAALLLSCVAVRVGLTGRVKV